MDHVKPLLDPDICNECMHSKDDGIAALIERIYDQLHGIILFNHMFVFKGD